MAHLISIMRRAHNVCLNARHVARKTGNHAAQSGVTSGKKYAN
jgi:hypothetical protein